MDLNWKKTKETPYKAGYRKMIKKEFRLPDGKTSDFDVNDGGNVVCILALTQDRRVILARQFRPGPEKILLELPGGAIETGEDPQSAAERELLEETGYEGTLSFVGESLHSAYDTLRRYNFVAIDCTERQKIQNDEHEFTEVVLMRLSEFRRHLQSGQLTDVTTGYLGLDFLKLL